VNDNANIATTSVRATFSIWNPPVEVSDQNDKWFRISSRGTKCSGHNVEYSRRRANILRRNIVDATCCGPNNGGALFRLLFGVPMIPSTHFSLFEDLKTVEESFASG
jgi:hypothetical protein